MDLRTVGAGERELLRRAEFARTEQGGVDRGETRGRLAARGEMQVGRRPERGPGDHDTLGGRGEGLHLSFTDEAAAHTRRRIDVEQRHLADVVGRGQQALAVEARAEMADRAVPVAGERTHLAVTGAAQHHRETVGLESRTRHGEPSEIAVRQEHRLRIPSRIVSGEVARRIAAVGRDLVEVEVRGPRLAPVGEPCTEHDARTVAAERVVLIATERLRRHIGAHGARHIDRLAGFAIGGERQREELRQPTVLPGVPVTHEQLVVDESARFVLVACGQAIDAALQVHAICEHLHRDGEAIAARGDLERADIEGQRGHLLRLAARERQVPDL